MNVLWGTPRIHSELLKLGVTVSQATVAKYIVRHRKPPSQTWKTVLTNHVSQLLSVDFFTVPTIWFEILFVFVVLAHDPRRIPHFNVTAHPTAEWTGQQIVEAFPFDSAPKYLLRDRDRIYGHEFRKQVEVMGINEVLSPPRSPWQRAYVERVIGSIRRECLDHVVVFSEESLRRASLLHPLLSRVAFAFIVGQGFAGFTRGPVCRESRRDFSSRRPALPIRPARSLTFRPLGRSRANRPTENYIARLSSTFVSMSFLMTLSKNPAHNVRSRDSRTFPTVDTLRKTSFTDFLV